MIIKNTIKTAAIALTILTVGCSNLPNDTRTPTESELQVNRYALLYGGSDENRNGVRDDVENYIIASYEKEYRKVLFDFSKTIRDDMMIYGTGDDDYYINFLKDIVHQRHCINKVDKLVEEDNARKYMVEVHELHSNTQLRTEKNNETATLLTKLSSKALNIILADIEKNGFRNCN